jgi:hypothetical protein
VTAVAVLPWGSRRLLGPRLASFGVSARTPEVPYGPHHPGLRSGADRAGVHQYLAAGIGRFLAGYSGLTRQAYELDLRQFTGWCHQHQLHLFQARRADIEFFARDLDSASSVDLGSMSIHRRASLCEASAATARTHPGGGHRYLANSRTSASRALRPALTCEAEG